jgi:hypothetical protein
MNGMVPQRSRTGFGSSAADEAQNGFCSSSGARCWSTSILDWHNQWTKEGDRQSVLGCWGSVQARQLHVCMRMDWNLLDGLYAYLRSDSTKANTMIIIRNPKKSSNTLARWVQLRRPCPQFRIHDLGQSHTARPSPGFGTLILTLTNHDDTFTTTSSSSYRDDRHCHPSAYQPQCLYQPQPGPVEFDE